ncbi:hypothetical protein HRbin06_00113 [archaeon HR06]|nr:hypothetical protein HRbin06_00113 [archaeon HR06]
MRNSFLALASREKIKEYKINYVKFEEELAKEINYLYLYKERPFNIDLGCEALNKIFEGLNFGNIIDIYGPSRTGKTQICFQLSLMASLKGYHVYYVDSKGTFRPERIEEMAKNRNLNFNMDKVKYYRINDYLEQVNLTEKLSKSLIKPSILIIDDFAYNFLSIRKGLLLRPSLLVKNLQEISNLSLKEDLLTLITNQVKWVNEEVTKKVKDFVHRRVGLKRLNGVVLANIDEFPSKRLKFKIDSKGIIDL